MYGDETLIELSDGVDDSSLYIYLMQIFYSFKYLLIPVTSIVFTSTLQHIMSFFSSINTNNAISSVIRVFFLKLSAITKTGLFLVEIHTIDILFLVSNICQDKMIFLISCFSYSLARFPCKQMQISE